MIKVRRAPRVTNRILKRCAYLQEIRAICNNYTHTGLPNHPSGIAFTFWEQYLDLNWNLVVAISVISFAVFFVVSLMLFSPWAAACILLILLTMTVELAGFLGFAGIKLNPVSAVSLITAVGIGEPERQQAAFRAEHRALVLQASSSLLMYVCCKYSLFYSIQLAPKKCNAHSKQKIAKRALGV